MLLLLLLLLVGVYHSARARAGQGIRPTANCTTVLQYLQGMAQRNELYSEEEHRSHINATVRLMRVGICRSKYWTDSRQDYDGEAVLEADKAIAAAIDAGVPEEKVKSRFVLHGIVDLFVVFRSFASYLSRYCGGVEGQYKNQNTSPLANTMPQICALAPRPCRVYPNNHKYPPPVPISRGSGGLPQPPEAKQDLT